MLSHVRWYFEVTRALTDPDPLDAPYIEMLEAKVLQMIEQITAAALPGYPRRRRHAQQRAA